LSVEDCFVRLTQSVPQSSIAVQFGVGSHLVRGDVGVSHFWITRNMTRNSWRVTLNGNLIPDANGTQIICKFSMAGWVEPYMSCMVIGVFMTVSFALFYIIYDIFLGRFHNDLLAGLGRYWLSFFILPLVFMFFRTFQITGRSSFEGDEKFLIQFLEKTIGAKQIE
jgi:hypothetical protein